MGKVKESLLESEIGRDGEGMGDGGYVRASDEHAVVCAATSMLAYMPKEEAARFLTGLAEVILRTGRALPF